MTRKTQTITFSFGRNWLAYLDTVEAAQLAAARSALQALLQVDSLQDKRFLDIGCGSGLSSAAALSLGARQVTSIDVDPHSVAATRRLQAQLSTADLAAPPGGDWLVLHGSVLDHGFLQQLPPADVVYSWGVLHHTGEMWTAIRNAAARVPAGGLFAIAIYNQTRTSRWWWHFKRLYNRVSPRMQSLLAGCVYAPRALVRLLRWRSPTRGDRGMSIWYDAVDWAGGYPYEYASADAVTTFCNGLGLQLVHLMPTRGTGCNQFLFRRD